jgi:hypothetical protein
MRSMRRVVAGFAVCLAGCAQLAGIDPTSGEALPGNSLAVKRLSVGKAVDVAPLDLTGLAASYLVTGATGVDRVAATNGGGGNWVTKLRAPAPVLFTLPDDPMVQRLYDFPRSALTIPYAQLEHPGRTPAPDGAMLTVAAHLDAPTTVADRFQIYTVGSWSAFDVPAPAEASTDVMAMYAFDMSSRVALRAQLDRLTAQDVFLVLRYADTVLTGVAEAAPFDQTGNDMVSATMTAVTADRRLDVTVSDDITQRYLSVRPAVDRLTMDWNLVAAPGAAIAFNAGPVLNSGHLMGNEVGVIAMYANPFAGPPHNWPTLLTLSTYETRTYKPSMDVTVTLYAGMNQYVEPAAGLKLNLDAGLPESIELNDVPLSNDGMQVTKPTSFVEVAISANPPANTLFGLQLYDLLPSADGTRLDYHMVLEALGTEARFQLPPEVFVVGHSYTLRAICTAGGFPALASGDLTARQLPMSQSYADSGVFTVMP